MLLRIHRQLLIVGCLCSLMTAEASGIWLDIPYVQQEKNGCGAAVVSMLMQYWAKQAGTDAGPSAEADRIQQALYSSEAHGIYTSALEGYLKEQGFRTFAFRGEWNDLEHHLRLGRPLIVVQKPAGIHAPLHYVVVAGIDTAQNLVFVNDPAQRKLLKEDRKSFEEQWRAANDWTLLAVPAKAAP